MDNATPSKHEWLRQDYAERATIGDFPFAFSPMTVRCEKVPIKPICACAACRMVDAEDARRATRPFGAARRMFWRAQVTPLPSPAFRTEYLAAVLVMRTPRPPAARAGR